jgi:hypothetical protein
MNNFLLGAIRVLIVRLQLNTLQCSEMAARRDRHRIEAGLGNPFERWTAGPKASPHQYLSTVSFKRNSPENVFGTRKLRVSILLLLKLLLPKGSRAYNHVFGRTESGQRLINGASWLAALFFAFILAIITIETITTHWKVILGTTGAVLYALKFPVGILLILYWTVRFVKWAWYHQGTRN